MAKVCNPELQIAFQNRMGHGQPGPPASYSPAIISQSNEIWHFVAILAPIYQDKLINPPLNSSSLLILNMSHLGRVILYKFAYIHEKIILNFNYRTLISTSAHKRGILNVSVLRLLVPGKPIFPIQLNPELCVNLAKQIYMKCYCHFSVKQRITFVIAQKNMTIQWYS